MRFSCLTSKFVCVVLETSIQWNREWFFFRRVRLDSGFNVMTVYEVSWHGPEVIYRFTSIRKWVVRWWKRRSSLIECQSFPNCKININPIYSVLVFLPCVMQLLCSTWYIQVNLFRIFVLFVPGINGQKEYSLSLAWILTSRNQSIVDDRMKIKSTSNMVNMMEEPALNYNIVL